jgi:hypothetical protein
MLTHMLQCRVAYNVITPVCAIVDTYIPQYYREQILTYIRAHLLPSKNITAHSQHTGSNAHTYGEHAVIPYMRNICTLATLRTQSHRQQTYKTYINASPLHAGHYRILINIVVR